MNIFLLSKIGILNLQGCKITNTFEEKIEKLENSLKTEYIKKKFKKLKFLVIIIKEYNILYLIYVYLDNDKINFSEYQSVNYLFDEKDIEYNIILNKISDKINIWILNEYNISFYRVYSDNLIVNREDKFYNCYCKSKWGFYKICN